jgi:hypothetical protein
MNTDIKVKRRKRKMVRGITITTYLVSGDPEGIICAYMSNWTGQAVKVPRNLLYEAKSRSEINSPGIYFLFGENENNPDEKEVYIGEADNLYDRISDHFGDPRKSFWNYVVAFSSKDDNLTVSHVKYLEYKVIKHIKNNSLYTLVNKTSGRAVSLPETAIADIETYFENLKLILPILGYNILEDKQKSRQSKEKTLNLSVGGLGAKGVPTNEGFLVYKGSKANKDVKTSLSNGYKNLRSTLIKKKILQEKETFMEFIQDYEFKSPSAAAAVIIGYPINGQVSWKNSQGKTLRDIESEIIGIPSDNEVLIEKK